MPPLKGAARATFVIALSLVLYACASQSRKPPPRPPGDVPDAVPQVEPRSARGNPAFYEVLGKRYFVLASASGYRERGVASWYGPKFHGLTTASGEIYDMYGMTAAHKTLPLPTYARVTNLRNGRSIVVKINDRGPFVRNRLIDLSYTAAYKLGMIEAGTSLVEVTAIGPDLPTIAHEPEPVEPTQSDLPPKPPASELYAQVGAFSDPVNAFRLRERLQSHGISPVFVMKTPMNGRTVHRVRVGPIASVEAYDALVAELDAIDIADVHLAMD